MLDRKLTEAQAYHAINSTSYAAAIEEEIASNIGKILSCNDVTLATHVHPDYRCRDCSATGKQVRSPFASLEHPHIENSTLVRNLAELYAWSPDTAESLADGVIEGEVHWLGDEANTPDNERAWKTLRAFQQQVEALRSFHTDEEFPAAIKQLRKAIIKIVRGYLANPSETKTKTTIREAAKALLASNKALSKADVDRLAVHLGEIFGFEDLVDSDFPNC